MIFFGFLFQISRNFSNFNRRICCIAAVNNSVHIQQIYDTTKLGFGADRQLQSHRAGAQTVNNHIQTAVEVGSDTIHLIAEADTGNTIFVSLSPNCLRLRLNAGNRVKHGNCTVKDAQRTLNFNSEVNVARSINDVNAIAFPEAGRSSRGNCNTALLFLFHPVHRCSTIVCFTDFVVNTGVIQDTLGCCGFTRINVSHNTDVSIHFQFMCTSHCIFPILRLKFVMGESFVSFSHLMSILTFFNGRTLIGDSV